MGIENLKEQLESLEKHLKWCIDNNKPQEHLDVHTEVISDIKQEIELKFVQLNLLYISHDVRADFQKYL